MSSSDSDEAPAALPPRGRAPLVRKPAAAESDSDDDATAKVPIVRGRVPLAAAARKTAADEDDEESTDEESTTDDGTGGEESEPDEPRSATHALAQWRPINYDDMTEEEFEALLKAKSKVLRLAEKKAAEEARQQMERGKEKEEPIEAFIDGEGGYTYTTMLGRVFDELRRNNPELEEGTRKIKLPVPKTEKSGSKKTALTNFREMCKAMGRPMEDVKDFIEKHLTTTSSIDANDCLIIKIQNVKLPQMEAMFQKYIEIYCRCNNCGRIETDLTRDASSRLWILKCRSCKASRTVQGSNTATYQASTAKRSRLRNKQLN